MNNNTLLLPIGTLHPELCPDCRGLLVLRWNDRYGPYYGCSRYPDCKGNAGAHPDGYPSSIPAGKRVKNARVVAHKVLDAWRKGRKMNRLQAYVWLKQKFGKDTHIGYMGLSEIKVLIRTLQEDCHG